MLVREKVAAPSPPHKKMHSFAWVIKNFFSRLRWWCVAGVCHLTSIKNGTKALLSQRKEYRASHLRPRCTIFEYCHLLLQFDENSDQYLGLCECESTVFSSLIFQLSYSHYLVVRSSLPTPNHHIMMMILDGFSCDDDNHSICSSLKLERANGHTPKYIESHTLHTLHAQNVR